MIKQRIVLPRETDRPRALISALVQTASRFECRINFVRGSRVVNGKSMLGVLALISEADGPVTLLADGPDEQEAVKAIEAQAGLAG